MELNGKCKRMSTMFNRIEKALSSQIEEIQHNAVKALALVKSELDDSKYCDFSSFKYNSVCVTVKISDRTADTFIAYSVSIEFDSDFDSDCKSMYYAKILSEILDNKTDNTATDNKTDNTAKIHHMKCEYFISSIPNSNLDCRHCIYYDYGACPADMEHYKLVCDD